jgi:drug/metabolite transporter (DMT)-like permease
MRSTRVYAVFSLVCAIFGTTFLAIKLGVAAGAPPFLFAGIRFTIAGLVLGAALLASGRIGLRALGALAPRAILLSLLYIVVNFGATFWAEQYIGGSTAAQIDAVGPIASAILSAAFLGKRLRPAHGLGIAAGFAGVWLIVRGVGAPDGGRSIIASVVMLGGAVGFAGASILYKRLFDDSVDSFAVNALNMLSGGLGLLVLSALSGERGFPATSAALLPLLYLVVAGSLVGHSANLWLVKKAGPLFTSSWSYVSPVIATAVGAAALGEKVSLWSAAGAALTLIGVFAISRAEMRGAVPDAAPALVVVPDAAAGQAAFDEPRGAEAAADQ